MLQETVYSNVRLLKDNIVVADTGSLTLSIRNPTRTLVKKSQQMPLYFDSKDKKIENNFTMTAVNLLADFEDLEGNFTLEVYNEGALAMKFNEVTLTTVNEVKGIVEGYAERVDKVLSVLLLQREMLDYLRITTLEQKIKSNKAAQYNNELDLLNSNPKD